MDKEFLGILQVNTLDNKGGAAKIAFDLFKTLNKCGFESYFAVGQKSSDISGIFQIPNDQNRNFLYYLFWSISEKIKKIPVLRILSHTHSIGKPLQNFYNLFGIEEYNYLGTSKLLNLIPEFKPNIVHCHNLHGGYFDLRVLPNLCKEVPIIITLHDAWLLSGYCHHSLGCERWKTGCGKCPIIREYPEIHCDATAYNWQRKRRIFLPQSPVCCYSLSMAHE